MSSLWHSWQSACREIAVRFEVRAEQHEATENPWLHLFAAIDRLVAEVWYAIAGGREEARDD